MRNPFAGLFRSAPEKRAITYVPWNTGGSLPAVVDQDRALSLVPVFAAVRLLASAVSTLPLKPYRRLGDERVPMSSLPALFDALATDGELVPWLHRVMTSLALRGNAYGLITSRDGFGFPTRIEWLSPSDVFVDDYRSTIRPVWFWKGREVPREDILHIPWFTIPGKVQGLSPIAAYARAINAGINAVDYGSTWFESGGFPTGKFKNAEQVITQKQADVMRARLASSMRNREPLVYGRDWDYEPVSVPPEEAQFVDTLRMTVSQIASVYGIPPEMIGGETGASMTYANVEQQQINFVMFTLRPWLVVLEHAFSAILPDRQYVRFNADALVRADLATRWQTYQIAAEIGAKSVDDIRRLEDEPPLPNRAGADYNTPAAKAARVPQLAPANDSPADGDNAAPQRMWRVPA